MLELETVALTALASHGVEPDVQEYLLRGNPTRGIRPMAIRTAINAIIEECVHALPGGMHCDPQQIADTLRAMKR